jgi:hypothetical protein
MGSSTVSEVPLIEEVIEGQKLYTVSNIHSGILSFVAAEISL